jgi:hypothetical protein
MGLRDTPPPPQWNGKDCCILSKEMWPPRSTGTIENDTSSFTAESSVIANVPDDDTKIKVETVPEYRAGWRSGNTLDLYFGLSRSGQ